MEYKSPLLNQIISILDKRSEACEKRIQKTEKRNKKVMLSFTEKEYKSLQNIVPNITAIIIYNTAYLDMVFFFFGLFTII